MTFITSFILYLLPHPLYLLLVFAAFITTFILYLLPHPLYLLLVFAAFIKIISLAQHVRPSFLCLHPQIPAKRILRSSAICFSFSQTGPNDAFSWPVLINIYFSFMKTWRIKGFCGHI